MPTASGAPLHWNAPLTDREARPLILPMRALLALILVNFAASTQAAPLPRSVSSLPRPGETQAQALHALGHAIESSSAPRLLSGGTAWDQRVSFAELDLSGLPQWTWWEAEEAFNLIRDSRIFSDPAPERGGFFRRLSWLYPVDGCFIRAHMMPRALAGRGLPELRQIFLFGGDMLARSHWAPGFPDGIPWVYHVTAIISIDGEPWIIDPALFSDGLLTLRQWVALFVTNPSDLKASICHGETLSPANPCLEPARDERIPDYESYSDMDWLNQFLIAEADNVGQMGFEPMVILGDSPPWFTPHHQAMTSRSR